MLFVDVMKKPVAYAFLISSHLAVFGTPRMA